MTKSEKEELQREHSQNTRKHSTTSHRRKNTQNRSLIDYFSKIESAQPSKDAHLMTQSQPEQEKQRILREKKEEVMLRMTSQKQQHQMMMSMVKTTIIKELKVMADIDRLSAKQHELILNDRVNKIDQLRLKIKESQRLMDNGNLNYFQRHFISLQLDESQQMIRRLQFQVLQLEGQLHLRSEEKNCFLSKQQWPLVNKRYQPLRLIGKGGFSEVYQTYDLENHSSVALKLSDVDHLLGGRGNKDDYLRHIKRQYKVHQRLNHPNVVKLIDVCEIDNAICIVLEYCLGYTLSEMIKKQGRIQQKQAKMIIQQLLSVIIYLSKQRVVHFDLKPQNIMFDQGCIKVLDFGICKVFDSEHSRMALTSQGMGSYCYLPPQTFTSNPTLTHKVDIWSLGVIFYEMLYGQRPMSNELNQKQGLNFPTEVLVSENAKSFMNGCLKASLLERLDPEQASLHPYFQS